MKTRYSLLVLLSLVPALAQSNSEIDKRSCEASFRTQSSASKLLQKAAEVAAQAYGENQGAIVLGLQQALAAANVEAAYVSQINYEGALESFPPQHQFKFILTNSSTFEASVTIFGSGPRVEVGEFVTGNSSVGTSPAGSRPIPEPMSKIGKAQPNQPPVTTMPIPSQTPGSAVFNQFLQGFGSNSDQVASLVLQKLKAESATVDDLKSINFYGLIETYPPKKQYTVTLQNGKTFSIAIPTVFNSVGSTKPSMPPVTTMPVPNQNSGEAAVRAAVSQTSLSDFYQTRLLVELLGELKTRGYQVTDVKEMTLESQSGGLTTRYVFEFSTFSGRVDMVPVTLDRTLE